MNDQLQIEKKKMLTLRVKNNIENGEWQKLIDALPVAEEAGIPKPLLHKAFILASGYLEERGELTKVINYLNKARSLKPETVKVFDKIIKAFYSFYLQFKEVFSKQDLTLLKETLLFLIDYHHMNFPRHQNQVKLGRELIQKIDYRLKFKAQDKSESPATFRVQQIQDAIYGDMTFEELRSEFARLIEPTVRDLLDEKAKEDKKSKDKKSKKSKKKK
jgi:hypothetical protein